MEELDIRFEDLSNNAKELAETIGIEALIKLAAMFGGSSVYIPQLRAVTKKDVYRQMRTEYINNNASKKELAIKYGISISTVNRQLKGERKLRKPLDIEGQLRMEF